MVSNYLDIYAYHSFLAVLFCYFYVEISLDTDLYLNKIFFGYFVGPLKGVRYPPHCPFFLQHSSIVIAAKPVIFSYIKI